MSSHYIPHEPPNQRPRNATATIPREPPIAQPTRSKTDLPTTAKPDRSRRPHARSLRNKVLPGSVLHQHGQSTTTTAAGGAGHKSHHSVRHAARNTVQSAIELKPPMTFEHLLRRDRRSPDSSRRGSAGAAEKEREKEKEKERQEWDFAHAQAEAEKRRVKPEQVVREKARNEKREAGLRSALKKVEEVGMRRTRELDDAYYSILEKAEVLRDAVGEMQELATETRGLRERFGEEVGGLERRVGGTLEGFGEFKTQEGEIDGLVSRLAESKHRTEVLNERLEQARRRVETYEKRYLQRQATRRKQCRFTWGGIVAVVAVLVALLVAKHHRHIEFQIDGLGKKLVQMGDAVDGVASPVIGMVKPSKSEDSVLESLFAGVV